MDYLFRLADGRRVALWSEKNQIIRQLSGGGSNRSHMTLRTDFLSDFSAASLDGKIYFTYQNTSRRVMLYLPDGEEDRLLFGESIESCRHSGMTLIAWNGTLYLFYAAWSPIKECYALKVRKPLEAISQGDSAGYAGGEEMILIPDLSEVPELQVISGQRELWVISADNYRRLTAGENGAECWQEGVWTETETVERWSALGREAEEFQAEQHRLREENTDLYEEIQRLAEECEKLRLEKSCEQNELRSLQNELRSLQNERRSLQDENQRLLQNIDRYEAEETETSMAREQLAGCRAQLQSAVTQYNELAEVARQLQIEGKKWRDKYYQETKKRRMRQPESD